MTTAHDGKVTVDMDIHVEKDWHECRAEARLDRGEAADIQSGGAASVRYSPEHDRYLVSVAWGDFRFCPTWDLAFGLFLQEVSSRVQFLGREYHARSRVKLTEDGAERPARPSASKGR